MDWILSFGILNYLWNLGIGLGIVLIIKKLDKLKNDKQNL
jgi:hypothetical protein